jgi:hypothetical protein
MRKISEVLRLRAAGHTHRAIARSLAIGHSTVSDYLSRATLPGVGCPLPQSGPRTSCTPSCSRPSCRPASPGRCRTGPQPRGQ